MSFVFGLAFGLVFAASLLLVDSSNSRCFPNRFVERSCKLLCDFCVSRAVLSLVAKTRDWPHGGRLMDHGMLHHLDN